MLYSLGFIEAPQTALLEIPPSDSPSCTTFSFEHRQTYLSEQPTLRLEVCCLQTTSDIECIIRPLGEASAASSARSQDAEQYYRQMMQNWACESVKLHAPWQLESLRIDKPWGAEVWYTGMEDRGICSVKGIPLPWLLALAPETVLGHQAVKANKAHEPILLKILDPLPETNLGDLYFELHEKKIEVYVVTHIDEKVWPKGVGQIRYGFSQEKIAQYDNIETFKGDYLKAVKRYQKVRYEIDDSIDKNEIVSQEQRLAEVQLKNEMYAFTDLKALQVGDVVQIQPFFPHSLQHGVRVIEFQTAHYERHILSFTQKVLTQKHWDTETALKKVHTDMPELKTLKVVENTAGVKLECIADFPQFNAYRLTLSGKASYQYKFDSYCLIIGITGESRLTSNSGTERIDTLRPEQSFFLSATLAKIDIAPIAAKTVLLIAAPKLS